MPRDDISSVPQPSPAHNIGYQPVDATDWPTEPHTAGEALDDLKGSGYVVGPAAATDNAIARYDGVTGKLIQDSSASIDDAGDLTATSINTTLIHNAAAIAIKPSGDNDDYFELSTSAGTPIITIRGDDYLRLKAGNGLGAVHGFLVGPDDGDNIQIGWDIASGYPFVYSGDGIAIQPSADIDDYILIKTVAGVPEMTTVGACNLKLSADGVGEVVIVGAPTISDFTNAQHDHSTAAEGGAVIKTLARWSPLAMIPPATDYPDRNWRGTHWVWEVDVDEYLLMEDVMPLEYLAAGFDVKILFACTAASQATTWSVQFERIGDDVQDMDADSFAAAQTVVKTSSATVGQPVVASIAFTDAQIDGIDPGEFYRMLVKKTVGANLALLRYVWIEQ